MINSTVRCVLFDLDGTLVDSAPDLAAAANAMRADRGLEPLPFDALRCMVGSGARGMVGAALGVTPEQSEFADLRDEFLARYAQGLHVDTRVFDAMGPVLTALESADLAWGVVTNKAERFALPLMKALQLDARCAVVICGDTTARSKPDPLPLLEAARRVGLPPAQCIYVGDDLRDVQAGRAAGMATLAAAWGYLGNGDAIDDWGADVVLEEPGQLLKFLRLA